MLHNGMHQCTNFISLPSKQSVSELKRQLETKEDGTSYDRVRQYRIGAYIFINGYLNVN
jgi:hypothetical protein